VVTPDVERAARDGEASRFGEHHAGGVDDHASFQVYAPHAPGGYCWFCHVAGSGGSLFDFLRLYYGLSAQDLWRKLQDGGGVW